ncbi:lysozyme [Pseudomonas corrugata]|uniref:lysozyme n=1 Tax=Pseudomonas corrugata TaxID=47879 RepID=UPI0028C4959D|nr:lysozyme [Pseudomonas corrugata]MDU9039975.1 lysozyme [Pseudomonas corrugata]
MSPLKQRILAASLAGATGMAGVLVSHFEGRNLVAYLDPVGIPTICEGVTRGVSLGQTKTPEQCDALLQAELAIAMAGVDRNVKKPQPETRRAALASFVYNVGEPQFKASTLLLKLNAGDVRGACAELSRWVNANGKKLQGLVNRRAAERELCEVGL